MGFFPRPALSHIVAQLVLTLAAIGLPGPVEAQTTDDLFNPGALQRIDLRMHSQDWSKLRESFQENTYYPADFVWNGQTVRNSGVRSRGLGSRSGTKPGLRVDFDFPGQVRLVKKRPGNPNPFRAACPHDPRPGGHVITV